MVRREALNWLKEAIADYRRAGRAFKVAEEVIRIVREVIEESS